MAVRPEVLEDAREVEARVPDLDVPHLGEIDHRLAVLTHGRRRDRTTLCIAEAALPTRDGEARCEPLDVPLERPRKGLVEVVDAEDAPTVGRREDAEVREVRVAAELRMQAGPRAVRKVRRHQVGGTTEEGERRGEHPPVADRAELGKSSLGLLLEKVEGVSPHRPRLPLPVNRARHVAARPFATSGALGRRELLHATRPA